MALLVLTGGILAAYSLRAGLTSWAENVASGTPLERVFFRNVLLPTGQVPVRRPPKETRAALTQLIATTPSNAELYSLRALESEQQLDFNAAENDWKKYVDVAVDKGAARLSLADYYHRRHQPQQEFEALTFAAREAAPASDRLLPDHQQRPWKTYERLIKLIDDQRLDSAQGLPQYGAWILRYPKQPDAYAGSFSYCVAHKFYTESDEVIAAYERAFPADPVNPVAWRAELAAKRGQTADALAIFERSYQPLWPDALVARYFDLLRSTNSLRVYLERTRTAIAANPTDVVAASRLYHYWQRQGNTAAADRVLIEFRQRKQARQSAWTVDELLTLAKLSEASRNYDETARNYYALYSLAGTSNNGMAETALGGLARLLISAPEQPIRFGSANLSMYRDVATMDPHPGFLNGVLSLVLNETDPPFRHSQQEQNAAPYFRRAQAAELISLFESRFPNSPARAELRALLIEAFAIYGDNAAVIRSGNQFLTDFPNASNRTEIAMRMADAFARTNQMQQEFAQYDAVLAELARRADNVPLGAAGTTLQRPRSAGNEDDRPAPEATSSGTVRSPEYARVLSRYVARLVSLRRTRDGLALYRREIDRNPNDPGLYDLLASFLEQNQLGAEIEQVYQKAIAQFQEPSWSHKLARWYLRQRRQADVARLTRDVVRIFSGTDLEAYFREIVTQSAPVGNALYLQLNLAAHQRFPHQLSFARNLLTAYTTTGTADPAAYEVILRQHWYAADDLRSRFFEYLSRRGRLATELSLLRTSNLAATGNRWPEATEQSPATVRMLAEGEVWRGHYEIAAPMLQALAASYPADADLGRETASVFRSLGANDASVAIENNLSLADPRDHGSLTRAGEMQADRGRFDQARALWDKIPEIDPANAAGYLETATVFWDYYRYEDALRWIETARTRLAQPALFAYQAGVIHENRRDYDRAIREFARGAIEPGASNGLAERRLIALARRPAYRPSIEQLTDNLVSGRNPQSSAFNLRIALLKSQSRRDDLERFLSAVAARADAPEALIATQNAARIEGFPAIEAAALERRVALTTDPVERMSLRLALAHLRESQGGQAGAQVIDALYSENPAILGAVRAAVDYHWRTGNRRRAVDILEEAAGRSEPGYRTQFTLEAVRKSSEAGDYTRARAFASRLLAADPFRADFVAAMADTYAREKNDSGLRSFYAAKIDELSKSQLVTAERIERTAAMRRALIPVLVRTRDFTAAVDQYVEILNRYPEDEGLAKEAAQFARTNNLTARLRDYYVKASNDSPKDVRWPMVLGRLETQFEDYPAAIAAYTRAAGVRPDRSDLLAARLNLEQRLLQFDEAAATAEKLYELTYRNSEWIDKLAEIRARQGRAADAVAVLQKGWIDGRPDSPQNYFTVAQKLESWGILADSRKYVESGLSRVPAGEESGSGEILFARLAIKLHDHNAALARIARLQDPLASQVAAQLGSFVGAEYAASDRPAFVTAITQNPRRILIARAAGYVDLEAQWLNAAVIAQPNSDRARSALTQLIQLQTRRMRFAELGQQIEAWDRALPAAAQRGNELEQTAEAYRIAGDAASELRVLQRAHARTALAGPALERFGDLLIARPALLATTVGQETRADFVYSLLNYVLQHAPPQVAQQAIAARGPKQDPLWANAYTSLAGIYYRNNGAVVRTAFTNNLGDMNIGARIGRPVNRAQQLAGDLWFYYGGRFGEYLAATGQQGSDDYLPAMAEAAPGRAETYFTLGEYYNESGDATNAAENYRYALELNASRADVHDRLAMLAAKAGRTDEAVAEWKLAFQEFTNAMNAAALPAKFWGDVHDTLAHIGKAKLSVPLRDDADRLLRLYVRRNGGFQVDPLLTGALEFSGDMGAGIAWIGDLGSAAPDPLTFFSQLVDREWIPDSQRSVIHERIVASARARVAQSFGVARNDAERQLWTYQLNYAEFLTNRRDNAAARRVLDALPEEARKERYQQFVPMDVRLAARAGQLPSLLASYTEPPVEELRRAGSMLQEDRDVASARRVLEFIYDQDLRSGRLNAASFLGLADIRLAENDTPGTLVLLRRMTLVAGEPFTGFDAAAGLLERTGHLSEAVEFLTSLTRAEPWNADARRRLNAAQSGAAAPAPASVPQTEQQLLDAIAATPASVPLRLALFRAALTAGHDALANAAGSSYLPPYLRDETSFSPYIADSFVAQFALADRIALARGLGTANQRMGRLRTAVLYYQIAQRLAPMQTAIANELSAVRRQLELQITNDARRPVVSRALDQDRLVRPRVTQ